MKQNNIFATVVSVAVIALTFVGCTKNEINPAVEKINNNAQIPEIVQYAEMNNIDRWPGDDTKVYFIEDRVWKEICKVRPTYDVKNVQCWVDLGNNKLTAASILGDMVGQPTVRVADMFKNAMMSENIRHLFDDMPNVVERIEAGECYVVDNGCVDGYMSYAIATKPSLQDDDVEILHVFTFLKKLN